MSVFKVRNLGGGSFSVSEVGPGWVGVLLILLLVVGPPALLWDHFVEKPKERKKLAQIETSADDARSRFGPFDPELYAADPPNQYDCFAEVYSLKGDLQLTFTADRACSKAVVFEGPAITHEVDLGGTITHIFQGNGRYQACAAVVGVDLPADEREIRTNPCARLWIGGTFPGPGQRIEGMSEDDLTIDVGEDAPDSAVYCLDGDDIGNLQCSSLRVLNSEGVVTHTVSSEEVCAGQGFIEFPWELAKFDKTPFSLEHTCSYLDQDAPLRSIAIGG